MAPRVIYLYDDSLRKAANRRGENYWFCYVREILDGLGVTGQGAAPASLSRETLADTGVLILGDYDAGLLPAGCEALLQQWMEAGGVLVGLATTGLDKLFGIQGATTLVGTEPFSVTGWMSLEGKDEASGLFDDLFPRTLAPVFAPYRRVALKDAVSLTDLWKTEGGEGEPVGAAVTRRTAGRGRAFYFAFNLAQAVWTYHQGRPVTQDVDGDGYLRTSDGMMLRFGDSTTVPCADLMMLILENMLAPAGIPFVHQLPPLDGAVPDMLFHVGGDDEASAGSQAEASRYLKSVGLPYHVNVMLGTDGQFHFADEDRRLYEENGHEYSLHFNFMQFPVGVTHPAPIEEEEFDRQVKLYVERFGKLPVCANTHCLRASGWADTARFGARRGLLGENSLIHHRVPPMNPTNLFGAPFGTMYPFFVYDDAAHGNERLVFVSVPIGFYEPGGAAGEESHPLFGKETFREDEYRRVTELACRYGWTLNLFIHPMSFRSKQYRTRETLQCMRDRVNELGARAVWHGTDAVTLWWHARAGTRLECRPGKREFTAAVAHAGGVLVRFLDTGLPAGASFTLDGRPLAAQRRSRLGRDWLYVLVPQGEHTLKVSGKGGPCSA